MSHNTPHEQNPMMIMHDFEGNESNTALEEWPLHITVTPFFVPEGITQDDALDHIKDIASHYGPIPIEPGITAMYGPNNDIPVTKVTDVEGGLHRLHMSLVSGLGEIGCNFVDLTYAKENYSPHASHKGERTMPDVRHDMSSISVVTKLPKGPGVTHNKVILEKIDLDR